MAIDKIDVSGEDFSFQKDLVAVMKITLASCWLAIDDSKLAVDVWKIEMSSLIELYNFAKKLANHDNQSNGTLERIMSVVSNK